ncbi:hypothetical protein ACFR9U_16995 [Halorientalis brevis]|uniref:Uncharacterized protein n=1 Tax=Halorientalis brevis TaxID=1126241 RepID=A0ABD6CEG4_9EURY|nr:hypothetical protein [Halorientalis brevis]
MPARDRLSTEHTEQTDDSHSDLPGRTVTAHQTTPDRFVFTESDNTDAWISTDLTVDLRR